jgi:C4-dicarboxylate-specific signal transduction histidine kinase
MSRNDELYDDLSRLNNELVNLQRELSKKNVELEKAHNQLERRVEERTAELRAANERLREEIAERERIEEESQKLRDELARLNRVGLVGALTAAIAHETNQPLAAILANARAALRFLDRDTPDLREVREALEEIVADDKRAGEVIVSLQKMVKKEEAQKEPYDLNTVIAEVLQLIRNQVALHGATITEDLCPSLPMLQGDPVQIQQVMLNLLMNALEAVRDQAEDAREVAVATRSDGEDGVSVEVIDSGPGIDPAIMESIFESFFSTKRQGMGLGLTLSRRIVDAQGGHVEAQNLPGGGAKVSFWLPRGDGSS